MCMDNRENIVISCWFAIRKFLFMDECPTDHSGHKCKVIFWAKDNTHFAMEQACTPPHVTLWVVILQIKWSGHIFFKDYLTHATVEVVLTPITQMLHTMSQKDQDTNRAVLRTWTRLTPLHLIYRYEGHLESKERFAIKKYLLIIGKKKNMQVLSHTFTYFST